MATEICSLQTARSHRTVSTTTEAGDSARLAYSRQDLRGSKAIRSSWRLGRMAPGWQTNFGMGKSRGTVKKVGKQARQAVSIGWSNFRSCVPRRILRPESFEPLLQDGAWRYARKIRDMRVPEKHSPVPVIDLPANARLAELRPAESLRPRGGDGDSRYRHEAPSSRGWLYPTKTPDRLSLTFRADGCLIHSGIADHCTWKRPLCGTGNIQRTVEPGPTERNHATCRFDLRDDTQIAI